MCHVAFLGQLHAYIREIGCDIIETTVYACLYKVLTPSLTLITTYHCIPRFLKCWLSHFMTVIMAVSQPTKPAAHIWDRTCAFLHLHLHPIGFHNISQATTSGKTRAYPDGYSVAK
jgi:hypothetical protein